MKKKRKVFSFQFLVFSLILLVLVGFVLATVVAFAGDPSLYEIRATKGVTKVYEISFSECRTSYAYIVDEDIIHMRDLFVGCGEKNGCFGVGQVWVKDKKEPMSDAGVLLHEVSLTPAQRAKIRAEAREHLKAYDVRGRKTIYAGLEKIFPGEFIEERYQNLLAVADVVCQCDQKYDLLQEALAVKPGGQEAYWVAAEIERRGQTDFAACECRYVLTKDWQNWQSGGVVVQQNLPAPIATPLPPTPIPPKPTATPVPPSPTPVPPTKTLVPTATKKPLSTATVVVVGSSSNPTPPSADKKNPRDSFGRVCQSFVVILVLILLGIGAGKLITIWYRRREERRKELEEEFQRLKDEFDKLIKEGWGALRVGQLDKVKQCYDEASLLLAGQSAADELYAAYIKACRKRTKK